MHSMLLEIATLQKANDSLFLCEMDQWNWEDSVENLLYKSIPFLIVLVGSNDCLLLYFQLYTKQFNLHFISDLPLPSSLMLIFLSRMIIVGLLLFSPVSSYDFPKFSNLKN